MSRSLGVLTLDLIAKTGGFESGMDKAARVADKKTREIERLAAQRAKAIEKAWANVGTAVTTVLGGLAVGATFNKFIQNTTAAENELAQLKAVLQSTGNAAGFTADQITGMADRISKASTFSGGEIIKAQTALLAFSGVQGRVFEEATQAAADMATRTGLSVAQAAETIGRALDVPSQGLSALSRQGFRFSEDTKKVVQALEEQGRVADAQRIILDALNESYGGAAVAARNTFGGAVASLQNTLNDLLTGGDGSLTEAKKAVEELNRQLQDPRTKQSVDALMQSLVALSAWAVKAMTEVIEFSRFLGEAVAKAIYGSADPIERLDEEIAAIQDRIRLLRDDLARPAVLRINPFGGDSMRKELDELEQRLGILQQSRASFVAMANAVPPSAPAPAPLTPIATRPGLPAGTTRTQKNQLDPLAESAKAYARALESLNQIQLAAETSGWNLSRAQSDLLRVMTAPEWLTMPEQWKLAIVAQAEFAHAAEQAAAEQARLNELLAATPIAQLERQRDTMQFLAQAFEQGRISVEQYTEAVQTALGNLPTAVEPAKDAFLDLTTVANDAARAMASGFTEYLFDPMNKSIKEMLLNFLKAVAQMMVQAAMLQAVKAGMSAMGIPFAKGGVFDGGGLQAFAKGGVVNTPTHFKFASGGTFKNGLMGEAGPEAIMPLKRGPDGKLGVSMFNTGGGEAGDTIVNITIHEGERKESSNANSNESRQFARAIESAVLKTIADQKRPGGMLYQ